MNLSWNTGMMQFLYLVTNKVRINRLVFISSVVAAFFYSLSVAVQSAELLVLYPQVHAPFSKIFEDISSGAEEGFEGDSSSQSISEGVSASKILRRKQPNILLALGNGGLKSLEGVDSNVPVVVGAVSHQHNDYPGISIVPDPKVIIDRLLLLSPSVGRIHVVKKSIGSDLQLDGADKYLVALNKELIVHQSKDIREAASIYARLIDEASDGDAIWILQDGSYVNSAIFSLLLDAAWSKGLIVFSSNPLHVKHGALFAVYPDNKNMGVSLGRLANEVLKGEVTRGMRTLQDTFLAVNERTSHHLGLSLTSEIKEHVNLLLPAR
jgi:putative ABC transport system substrate-binding protein